jgi:hypothetical protein
MPQPSIGRDVHYMSRGSADGVFPAVCRAAKITEVGDGGRVGLAVINPDGLFFHPLTKDGGIAHVGAIAGGDGNAPGTWHWPEISPEDTGPDAEQIAKAFHDAYEALAPDHGYETREASAKPWKKVPDNNRNLMVATVRKLIDDGMISRSSGTR